MDVHILAAASEGQTFSGMLSGRTLEIEWEPSEATAPTEREVRISIGSVDKPDHLVFHLGEGDAKELMNALVKFFGSEPPLEEWKARN